MASKLLKDLQVRNAKPLEQDYRLTDGEGLYLLVKPNGSKLWRYNYSFENNKYVYSIGKYPEISLERARILHQNAIRLKADGINPVDQKRKAKLEKKLATVNTFKAIAKEWLEKKKRELAEKTFEGVERRVEKNLYPILGDINIREIKKQDVASALKIADLRSPEVASRCLGYAKNIFEYAEDLGVIEFSVISSMTAGKFLTKYENERFAHIKDPKRLKELLIAIDSYSGEYVVRQLLRLLPLVALRPTEARAATWNEIDFEKKIWSIGKERMKMRKDHIVPLSSQALKILEELHPYTQKQ
ncbi:Prophage integrase IntA [Sulfurospirillum diekertiae]|nr:integrase arm-type DNA-binding domain-containing protein [Sulfurospirillum diekertiae]ASC92403.1 Prophage integrase IntA [Sulfurospirillum diekertiae]